jgi:hypothetical protein
MAVICEIGDGHATQATEVHLVKAGDVTSPVS